MSENNFHFSGEYYALETKNYMRRIMKLTGAAHC
jgi:hypothetical protein